jgi:arabinose-5-phosphate isomerase
MLQAISQNEKGNSLSSKEERAKQNSKESSAVSSAVSYEQTLLKGLLDKERQYLDYFLEHLDLQAMEVLLKLFHSCKGVLFFTGIGKSEVMAQKIAVTMTSTGTRALFLASTNALHGDIGIISERDILVMLSKSGESEELLNLVPFVRNKGAKVIAIVSNSRNRLVQACDMSIVLPLEKELCPYDLCPTVSTQIQMIFGDILTVALMSLKEFSLSQYAENHPGGKIGRRITTKIKDLLISGAAMPICHPNDKLIDTLVELSQKRCGCVLVVDEESRLLGIFTDGDLGRALTSQGPKVLEKPISALMTLSPRTIGQEELAWTALQRLEADQKHPITVLAVTDENQKLLGIIKMHDIVQAGI